MRNNTVSIAKSLGIMLMVVGHSGCPTGLYHFIYFFHMPLFFFISGYFFNPESTNSKKIFLSRKVKTLWVPFVKWSFIFLLLHNVLFSFRMEEILYTQKDFWQRVFMIPFMFGEDPLVGGYWFLNNLFYCSLLCLFFTYFFKHFSSNLRLISGSFVVIGVLGFMLTLYYNGTVDNGIIRQLPGMLFSGVMFGFGYTFAQFNLKFVKNAWLWIVSLGILILGVCLKPLSRPFVGVNPVDSPYILLMALVGIYFVFYLSTLLNKTVFRNLFGYIGDHSLIILTFHFLAFKLVSLFIIYVNNLSINQLAIHPHIKFEMFNWWWILYAVVGVSLPLVVEFLITKTKTRLIK